MNDVKKLFEAIGEPYAAGVFERPDASYFYRHACGFARYMEHLPPSPYEKGQRLYPHGNAFFNFPYAMRPQFAKTYNLNEPRMRKKSEQAMEILRSFTDISKKAYHILGTWTHGAPNYKRILREGLDSYRTRILAQPDSEFKEGLLLVIDSLKNYLQRSLVYLRSANADPQLIAALEQVPFKPARTLYEGLVAWNIIFYFDGADNLGYLDDGLDHLCKGEDMTDVIEELFINIDEIGTWSCNIGAHYNDVTRQALVAIRGHRRPMLQFRVTPDMPDDLWELAAECIRQGNANPAFYNENAIQAMLHDRFPHIPANELKLYCCGGCTETNLQGLTRAGGTDGEIRLASIMERYLYENLAKCDTYEAFYDGLLAEFTQACQDHLDLVTAAYEYEAKYLPNPVRSLFWDDCIEKGKDFNAGGARYTYAQSSHSGLINVVDSLAAIRELVYRKKQFTAEEFLEKLQAEDETFFRILQTCPCYGVDNDDVDVIARNLAKHLYMQYRNRPATDLIEAYLFTEHQFNRHDASGKLVGPTPDGRHAHQPLCESIGALRGKAVKGPTAMLNSAAKLPQHLADGMSVLNLTLNREHIKDGLKPVVLGYFAQGGMQIQITSTSKEELLDALAHPEQHNDLIVRVGGYSEYFNNLSPELKQAVVQRSLHDLA